MRFSLPPLQLELACPEGPVREVLLEALSFKGALPLPDDAPAATPDLHLVFEVDPETAAELEQRHRESIETSRVANLPGELTLFKVQEGYLVLGDDAAGLVEPERQRATLWLGASYGEALTLERRSRSFYLLTLPLLLLVTQVGYYPLHAAALVRDGCGLLLSAAPGQGKTTATLNLIANGWSYLTDDTVLLRREDDTVQAFSYRRAFSLTDDTLTHFQALGRRTWPRSPGIRDKRRVEPEEVFPGSFQRTMRPTLLVFPELREEASRMEEIPAWSVYGTLVRQSAAFTVGGRVQKDYLQVLASLTRQCAAARLVAGPDLLTHPERLNILVQDFVARGT